MQEKPLAKKENKQTKNPKPSEDNSKPSDNSKTTDPTQCVKRHKQTIEGTPIESLIDCLPGREKATLSRMDYQVRRFCEKMEKFKYQQMEQGYMVQIPDIF